MTSHATAIAFTFAALAARAQESRPATLQHVIMIGASVTAGFSAGRPLLDAAIRGPHEEIETLASGLFGVAPEFYLKSQVETAQRREPTITIGMDALFWFLYQPARPGLAVRTEGGQRVEPEGGAAARLALLEKGLAVLATVRGPLVVGEIPDRHDVRFFIRPEQMPGPATLAKANERIRAWARERPQVLVLPLASWVDKLRSGTLALPPGVAQRDDPAFPADVALGPDRLHPSAVGQALLCAWLVQELSAWSGIERGDLALQPDRLRRAVQR